VTSRSTNPLRLKQTERFYALRAAAQQSFVLSKTGDARSDASNLLALLPQFSNDWNYGNAVHDFYLVLGRIAVQEGRTNDAKRHLLEAGKVRLPKHQGRVTAELCWVELMRACRLDRKLGQFLRSCLERFGTVSANQPRRIRRAITPSSPSPTRLSTPGSGISVLITIF
jgi:hypothetical protein